MLLDGEESEMVFIDHPSTEMSVSGKLPARLFNSPFDNLSLFVWWWMAVCVGGELPVHLRAALLCGCVFRGGAQLLPRGRGDNKLLVAREHYKGKVCDSGGQQSGFGEGACNYHSG